MSEQTLNILVYSDDKSVREQVKSLIGTRLSLDLPPVKIDEVATATIAQDMVDKSPYDVLILDGEATKIGGTVLSRTLLVEQEFVPPIVMLVARPQDEWLAGWSGANVCVQRPLTADNLPAAVLSVLGK